MYKSHILLLLVIVTALLFVFSGCDDDGNPYKQTYRMDIIEFPTELGNNWQYSIDDSNSALTDTVDVIISRSDMSGTSVWHYQYKYHTDSQIVQILGDTVFFYEQQNPMLPPEPVFRLVFPIKVGATWHGGSTVDDDTCEVVSISTTGLKSNDPIGPVIFYIERTVNTESVSSFYRYGISPHLGIVSKLEVHSFLSVTITKYWKMNYHIPDNEVFNMTDMPFSPGTYWEYDVYDYESQNTVPETLIIRDSSSEYYNYVSFIEYDFWGSGLPVHKNSNLYPDRYYFDWNNDYMDLLLMFPMVLYSTWEKGTYDTYTVEAVSSLTTDYDTYPIAFKITRDCFLFEDDISATIWLVPGIGIVQLEFQVIFGASPGQIHRKYTLKEMGTKDVTPIFFSYKYPLIMGAYWNYTVYNHLVDSPYTMHTEYVGGGINEENKFVYFYEMSYFNEVDTNYVFYYMDTIHFNRTFNGLSPIKGLVFPFEIGDGWSIMQYNDTANVISWEEVNFINGGSYDAYKLETYIWCGDECGHREIDWYVPRIGLVKKDILEHEYNIMTGNIDTLIHETWELDDYIIPQVWIDCTMYHGTNLPMKE